jgi:non-heme chloroperoxidase
VVLLHGGGQTRHSWRRTAQRLADRGYYCIAYDARGHGDSDWSFDGRYSDEVLVEDLASVVAVALDRAPVLLGASLGGTTSLLGLGESKVSGRALILVDVALEPERRGAERLSHFARERPDGFESLEEVAAAIGEYRPNQPSRRDLNGLWKNLRWGEDERLYWHWDPKFWTRRVDVSKRRIQLEACAGKIGAPALLVRGGSSDLLSESEGQRFARLFEDGEYVTVVGASHMVTGDRNDVFDSALAGFLERIPPD